MNRFEKRRVKQNIYKHANAIMYTLIFVMASAITIVAAVSRNDVQYVDENTLSTVAKDAIEVHNGESIKVAATGIDEPTVETTQEEMTQEETTQDEVRQEETTVENTTKAAETNKADSNAAKVKVTADTLMVRSAPSEDAQVLGTLDQDDTLDAVSISGGWVTIEFEGQQGYISSAYVDIPE